jgi:Uma2 family endonuclease
MALPAVKPAVTFTTPQEYLALERVSNEKHEYFQGKVIAMAGASLVHNRLVANLLGEIREALKNKPREVLPSDIRIAVPSGESYMYPDVTIVCGQPELTDAQFDTLKNPMVIFEVLSPSNEDHDRGKKFFFYRQIPSFKEYILVDSTKPFVEISRQEDNGAWKFETITDLKGQLFISSIGVSIPIAEVYRNAGFQTEIP